jgi:hypothetical protein
VGRLDFPLVAWLIDLSVRPGSRAVSGALWWCLRGLGSVGVNQIGGLAKPVGVFFGCFVDDQPYSFRQTEKVSLVE